MRLIHSLLITAIVLLTGCTGTRPPTILERIQLGQDKQAVAGNIGRPDVVRGAVVNRHGQTIEVWEYALAPPRLFEADQDIRRYWLYFVDNRLSRWGEAGDWRREADRIYELRFKPGPKLRHLK